MVKQISTLAFFALACLVHGQGRAVVQVLSPSSIADVYEHTHADTTTWGVDDLNLPGYAQIGALVIARDGSPEDTLGCETLTNPDEIMDNIAVIYRGTCNFSLKALNAQNAGAKAVLIINNEAGLTGMTGGDYGLQVTIPVAQISQDDGATIRAVMETESVVALIGNNYGLLPNNLSIDVSDVLVPAPSAQSGLVVNESGLEVSLGGYISNFGSDVQPIARLRAIVTQDGTELYNEAAEVVDFPPGDRTLVLLPNFSQSSYDGSYTITYSVETDSPDDAPFDNTRVIPFLVSDVISFAPVSAETGLPLSNNYLVTASFSNAYSTCLSFSNSNAAQVAVSGLYFTGTVLDRADPRDTVMTNALVTAYAYEWTDPIASPFTRPTEGGLRQLTAGTYTYEEDLDRQAIFIPFTPPIVLENDSLYLFCAQTTDSLVLHGWNSTVDYSTNSEAILQTTTLIQNGTTWYNTFNGVDGVPSVAVKTIAATNIGINENDQRVDITPFPNPTQDHLRIPMKGFEGAAVLRIFGLSGSLVSEQKVAVGGSETMLVDLSSMANGTYMFHVDFENGKRSDFRVVVAK